MKKVMQTVALLSLSAALFTACGEDEESGTQPTADFTFKIKSDLTVTFTNNSEEGETYAWDFGDGGTSAEESPSYKYAAKSSYEVKLTVTNGSKTDVATKTLDLVNNTPLLDIDGVFTDWSNTTGFSTPATSTEFYGIAKVKVTSDANYVYFYAEMVKSVASHLTIYMRLSNTTKIYHPSWLWDASPIDAFMQFSGLDVAGWTYEDNGNLGLKGYEKDEPEWVEGIELVPPGLGIWDVSGTKDIATKATFDGTEYPLVAIELSLKRSLIPTEVAIPSGASTIGVAFYLQAGSDWADAGYLPVRDKKIYTYNLNTKVLSE
jgi:PKD repeat protein